MNDVGDYMESDTLFHKTHLPIDVKIGLPFSSVVCPNISEPQGIF